jgi:mannitol/fructose-specific phosphotransferase system IIA component (Ntr-type)
MPTDLGFGMAVPHARVAGLDRPLVVFGRSPGGIVFDPQSPEPVRLIFLLVTPADEPNLQVLLLSQLVGLAGDPEVRRRLRTAASVVEVGKVLAMAAAGLDSPAGGP